MHMHLLPEAWLFSIGFACDEPGIAAGYMYVLLERSCWDRGCLSVDIVEVDNGEVLPRY